MSPDDRDAAYLWDMLLTCRSVADSLSNVTLEQYIIDENLRLATERRIEIIGEAANRVSGVFRDNHPGIPWRRIIAQRNVLVHDYGDIDNDLIWTLVTTHIPKLITELESIVPSPPNGSETES